MSVPVPQGNQNLPGREVHFLIHNAEILAMANNNAFSGINAAFDFLTHINGGQLADYFYQRFVWDAPQHVILFCTSLAEYEQHVEHTAFVPGVKIQKMQVIY